MASGQYGCAVFERYAKHFRLVVGGNFKLVADGCCQHVVGRRLALCAFGAESLHGVVFAARHFLAVDVEAVASDAVERRCSAGVVARMADSGNGGHVVNHLVFAVESFAHHSLEASFAKLVVVVGEVVPAHLVEDDAHHEFRSLNLRVSNGSHAAEQQCQ